MFNHAFTLYSRSLRVFKLMALQVAVIRPILLFIAAVMWTDGHYNREVVSVEFSPIVEYNPIVEY